MFVLIFSTNLSETFLILTRTKRDVIIKNIGLYVKCLIFVSEFNKKLEFSRQIFAEYSNVNFHKNPSNGSRVVPCERKDGLTDMKKANKYFSQFCKRA